MDVKEKAMIFAINAFEGKVRKAEPEKDSVLHSIDVANKLKSFGFDDNVIAAGYLHDVVEDTKYTIEDIEEYFGSDIASLVKGATEEDLTLSWEERKSATIKRIKNLDLRHKAVIACDKLSNSEDLLYLFGKKGKEDYSSFRRGRNKKLWYWEEVYKSLIHNQDKNLPMFKELKRNINRIFYDNEITNHPKDIIKFKKLELKKLLNIVKKENEYQIEITGNKKEQIKSIKKSLNEVINLNKILPKENINIINKLVKIDMNYIYGQISSDLYIELLNDYLIYIKNNIDKIFYIISNDQNNNPIYMNSLKRILNILRNNDVEIDIINIEQKDSKLIIIELCNNILTTIRKKRLKEIKKLIKRKQIG